jgi:AmmeMemoRadiSam system protein B
MQTRKPIVAGQFYSGDAESCLADVKQCLEEAHFTKTLPETIVAGIVPHAGWVFSGSIAAMVFSTVKQQYDKVDTFAIFGAAHGYYGTEPAVYAGDSWLTPLGDIAINQTLAEEITKKKLTVEDSNAHQYEHSIEVQVPFVQHLFPKAKLLPILTPPTEASISLGSGLGQIIREREEKIICIGSTDLTHYGPRYGFIPMGAGADGLKWATEVNDQKFIDLALRMEPKKMLVSAAEHSNACGAGAAGAAVAAAKELGKTKGVLLAHTNSNEIMAEKMHSRSAESVGYAAIVF